MDRLSIAGVVAAVVTLAAGIVLKGASLGALWNFGAFVVVFLGTSAAVLLRTPMPEVRRALANFRWVFRPPAFESDGLIERIVAWSVVSRTRGLLALERRIDTEHEELVRKGLQLLVDGTEPATIRDILAVEIDTREEADMDAARMFENAGIYSPTMGIIGAVMGLMAAMQHLGNPGQLGAGIAAAFVSTIYGISLGYLFMLPIASKLKSIAQRRAQVSSMLVEGLVAIARGENPHHIESKLRGFVS
ncbi:MAG TPA: flagellar motor protein [Rhodanobacteraceae bacterium]|nr:flagellar motor protein [Rhodanobacteraceae bacterium]